MSISTLPNEQTVGITTRIRELCSEFKSILRNLEVGDKVALFKIHSNVPLKRQNRNIYLLSSGVGLATFRPLVLSYWERPDNISRIHSLNIDSTKDYLFTDIFESAPVKNFTSQYVDNRKDYYEEVKNLPPIETVCFMLSAATSLLCKTLTCYVNKVSNQNKLSSINVNDNYLTFSRWKLQFK